MSNVKLMPHQDLALIETCDRNRVAYYHGMGSGKTFTGGEKMFRLNTEYNVLVCQRTKIDDWIKHFKTYYPQWEIIDYRKRTATIKKGVVVISYDTLWRRNEFRELRNFTLMLDESSSIQNETSNKSKFILKRLHQDNVILLSGTPCSGRYEKLWSQCQLLGWHISKRDYYARYIIEREITTNTTQFPIKIVVGYKNVEELKIMLRKHGAHFLKTEDVVSLPEQTFVRLDVPVTAQYKKFRKKRVVELEHRKLIGDDLYKKMLYERILCGSYCKDKLASFADLLGSTDDRLIVFYNFNEELVELKKVIGKSRPISEVNGSVKDLTAYENEDNSVTLIQYQAGARGLNLQKADKTVYFTLPLSSDLFEQSKCRTYRIGQTKPCFYYTLICAGSIEEKILKTLEMRKDYNETLFEEDEMTVDSKRVTRKMKKM